MSLRSVAILLCMCLSLLLGPGNGPALGASDVNLQFEPRLAADVVHGAYGNGHYVVVGGNSIYHSVDAEAWTDVANGNADLSGMQFMNVVYTGTKFVILATDGAAYVSLDSTDGETWNTANTIVRFGPYVCGNAGPHSFVYALDKFWFASRGFNYFVGEGPAIYSSTDGIEWNSVIIKRDTGGQSSRDVMFSLSSNDIQTLVSVGDNNNVLASIDKGLKWQNIGVAQPLVWENFDYLFVTTFGRGKFLVGANDSAGGRILYSEDGVTWAAENATTFGTFVLDIDYLRNIDPPFFLSLRSGADSETGFYNISRDGMTWQDDVVVDAPVGFDDVSGSNLFASETKVVLVTKSGTAPGIYTASTTPSQPRSVTAVDGNGSAVVRWTVPAFNGASAIISYTVTSDPGGVSVTTQNGNARSMKVPGLTNGTSYTFTVFATNKTGGGAVSLASAAVTPATVPGAPTNVTAVDGNASATVSWTAPGFNGGSDITSYTVVSTPDNVTVTTATGGQTSITVPGLTNGTAYRFKVFATNRKGNGLLSGFSNSVTPATVPDAPTNVTAVDESGSARVSWTAPAFEGGSAVTSYTVTSSPGGITVTTPGGSARSILVPGLTNGTAYAFTVFATNRKGNGALSSPSTAVTPATVPEAPTDVTAVDGNASATVSWTAPGFNGGSDITSYTVVSSPGGVTVTTPTGGQTSIAVSGLTNGTAYKFRVFATNRKGNGPRSSPSNSVTPATVPDAPTNVTAVDESGSARVSWTAPAFEGGSAVSSYTVTSSPGGITVTTPGGSARSILVPGLTNGTAYTFTVFATNRKGNGAVSPPSIAVTPATIPDAPTNVTAVEGSASATVTWTAPGFNGGSDIMSYTVVSSPDGVTVTTPTGEQTSTTVTGLANGTAYKFRVFATNRKGDGPRSEPSNSVTPSTVPVAPTNVTATGGNGFATVSWTAPVFNGGSVITSYTVTSSPEGITVTTPGGSASSIKVSGLTNGTPYTFTVFATNANGNGPGSLPSNAVTPATTPGAPTGVTAEAGNASAVVHWTPPASDGGSPITSYTVISTPDGATATTSSGEETSINVLGLTNGTAYRFQVIATNGKGDGPRSAVSNRVIPTP